MSMRVKILLISAVVFLAAASRLVEHPFNFTPIVAMSIFAGCYLQKRWGVFLPLAAMFLSDYFIGFYDWQVMASVYLSIALAYGIGWVLRRHKKWHNIFFAALASSFTFFIVTNFAVWAFFDWYPHTWAGLLSDFTLALPFFRNTVIGDLVYTFAFFGVFELVLKLSEKRTFKYQQR
ncbi:MAG: hypothetical protein UT86_C0001G0010 [Candidatus Magasanikbacteria bacterium GW2011_GWC2_40_17]|uniref:Rod shape-determining protein MreD n=1 Tax=Candidatus Magasanikbacteria bacterium GW2011_GWA2_42_32 TaxID=1619039 RepID=A0A0G1A8L1_9BACT|nr:MAG: hypothetical protein UT86_C0001G0010 [Candidatus Magasanikbacteria bacterium GW2011_GWC2_40_17]KKS57370.1 MAG: hypothetical protein UV20_C0001G0010 [Candidatus Magasanikbacteria bacterium GW2011_GWA2_42_32]